MEKNIENEISFSSINQNFLNKQYKCSHIESINFSLNTIFKSNYYQIDNEVESTKEMIEYFNQKRELVRSIKDNSMPSNYNMRFNGIIKEKTFENILFNDGDVEINKHNFAKTFKKVPFNLIKTPVDCFQIPTFNEINCIIIYRMDYVNSPDESISQMLSDLSIRPLLICHHPFVSQLSNHIKEYFKNYKIIFNSQSKELLEMFEKLEFDISKPFNCIFYDKDMNIISKSNTDACYGDFKIEYEKYKKHKEILLGISKKEILNISPKIHDKSSKDYFPEVEIDLDKYNKFKNAVYNELTITNMLKFHSNLTSECINLKFTKYLNLKSNSEKTDYCLLTHNNPALNKITTGEIISDWKLNYHGVFKTEMKNCADSETDLKKIIKRINLNFALNKFDPKLRLNISERMGTISSYQNYSLYNSAPMENAFTTQEFFEIINQNITDVNALNVDPTMFCEFRYREVKDELNNIQDVNLDVFNSNGEKCKFSIRYNYQDMSKYSDKPNEYYGNELNIIIIFNNASTIQKTHYYYCLKNLANIFIRKSNSKYKVKFHALGMIFNKDDIKIIKAEMKDSLKMLQEVFEIDDIFYFTIDEAYDVLKISTLDDTTFIINSSLYYENYKELIDLKHDNVNSLSINLKIRPAEINQIDVFLSLVVSNASKITYKITNDTYIKLTNYLLKFSQVKLKNTMFTPYLIAGFLKKLNVSYNHFDDEIIFNKIDEIYVSFMSVVIDIEKDILDKFIIKAKEIIEEDELVKQSKNPKFNMFVDVYESCEVKIGQSCSKCQTELNINIPHYYCNICDIYFCTKCGRKEHTEETDFIKKLPHEHILLYLNVKSDYLLFPKAFLPSNSFLNYVKYDLPENPSFCCICSNFISDLQYQCLTCSIYYQTSDYKYCFECIKLIEENQFMNDSKRVEKLLTIKNHSIDSHHVYAKVYYTKNNWDVLL